MVPDERLHDTGAKTLLNGRVAPAGLSAREDMAFALDTIFEHPNVGVLVSRQLIQRLVTSNPTPDYLERVAGVFNDNGGGERGDLAAVVKAILMDDEARNGHLNNPDFGKLREPVVRWAHMWRALGASTGPLAEGVHNTPDFDMYRIDEMGGQAVLQAPSVFNFHHPDHAIVPGGTMLSPEMQIMTEANLAATHNNYHHQPLGAGVSMLAGPGSAATAGCGESRSLVCLFLAGGADSFNMFVPGGSRYHDYRNARRELAVAESDLLPVTDAQQGSFAFHRLLPAFERLYSEQRLSVLSNTGTLIRPTTKSDYLGTAALPQSLFAHNTQQKLWQTGAGIRKNQLCQSQRGRRRRAHVRTGQYQ